MRHSLPALDWNPKLAEVGLVHSREMAEHNYFSHTNRRGEEATDRAKRAGYECSKVSGNTRTYGVAENIYTATLYHGYTVTTSSTGGQTRVYDWKTPAEMADETVESWMDSPGHRANLLHRAYDSEGIGVAVSGRNVFYITQDFC